ncbi:uncharacterized protein PSFLO_06043 [Pseudozyma flocculosa]|uniref:N-acetyl-D-glucosamine kinase n=1 Tax=Pseudozyma flocculosa TaxID=84751 RepID=A0A5C3FAU2_9BASI|nr:uncharacterized protein PSFLO_06043 [Pseudozyma flocculosa]
MSPAQATADDLVVCVDAGGTKTQAVVASRGEGQLWSYRTGSGNCATLGIEAAARVVLEAVQGALREAGYHCPGSKVDSKAGRRETTTIEDKAGRRETTPIEDQGGHSAAVDLPSPPTSAPSVDEEEDEDSDKDDTAPQRASPASAGRGPLFKAVWIGSAGISSRTVSTRFRDEVRRLLAPYCDERTAVWISNDAVLLSAAMLREPGVDRCVCLIAGTGSAGFSFRRSDGEAGQEGGELGEVPGIETVSRAGGWGYVLGDHGSGWRISLAAVQLVLRRYEERRSARRDGAATETMLERRVCAALGVSSPEELIAATYVDRSGEWSGDGDAGSGFYAAEDARKRWMAGATQAVFSAAFGGPSLEGSNSSSSSFNKGGEDRHEDEDDYETSRALAREVLDEAIDDLVALLERLTVDDDGEERTAARADAVPWLMVLGGGLWTEGRFVEMLVSAWSARRGSGGGRRALGRVRVVREPALEAGLYLRTRFLL